MTTSTRRVIPWWCLGGALFGLLFPIAGWLWAGDGLAPTAIATAHREQPVMTIVAMAPLILAAAGASLGVLHGRLRTAYLMCEQTVQVRTAELQEANNRLVEMMRAKDHFVSTVGHEIRTPVSAVYGFAEHLAATWQACDDDTIGELLDVIAGQAGEISDILEDLLVASREDLGSLSIQMSQVDLGDLVADCIKALCPSRKLHDRIRTEASPVTVDADPIRVRQIVRNLVTNAGRYGGRDIVISTGTSEDFGYVCVADSGDGVPHADTDRIFEPYAQSSGTPGVSGSVGIGLSVSRALARLMGGDVMYRRRHGWTEFELRLPVSSVLDLHAAATSRVG